jgi:predicted transcriptional regulator
VFYIVVNNNATEYNFDYIDNSVTIQRLEPTLVSGQPRESKLQKTKFHKVFAIDLMSHNVISVKPAEKFYIVKEILAKNKIHHLPVIEDEKLLGLITTSNLHRKVQIREDEEASELMESTVLCAHESTPLEHVLQVFIKEKIHSILLLNEEMRISGILTQNDIFKWIIDKKL